MKPIHLSIKIIFKAMRNEFLVNAPLKEVLLELHWDLDFISEEGIQIDKGFEQAVLNFTQGCQQDYRKVVVLKPDNIPPAAFAHRVTHRFHKVDGHHPLYQLGPGVFTVNDSNRNYQWGDFRQMIEFGTQCLQTSYDRSLVLSKVEIRYIDQVSPYIFGDSDKFEFLRSHMQINPEPYAFVKGELEHIQFVKRFSINAESALTIVVSTGLNRTSKEDIIEWHTFVTNARRLSWSELMKWVDTAHDLCSNIFKKMVSKRLYEYFGGKHFS